MEKFAYDVTLNGVAIDSGDCFDDADQTAADYIESVSMRRHERMSPRSYGTLRTAMRLSMRKKFFGRSW